MHATIIFQSNSHNNHIHVFINSILVWKIMLCTKNNKNNNRIYNHARNNNTHDDIAHNNYAWKTIHAITIAYTQ